MRDVLAGGQRTGGRAGPQEQTSTIFAIATFRVLFITEGCGRFASLGYTSLLFVWRFSVAYLCLSLCGFETMCYSHPKSQDPPPSRTVFLQGRNAL